MSPLKAVLLLSLSLLANPAWSAGPQFFHHVALSWQSESDTSGYSINVPYVSLIKLQQELLQQKTLQTQNRQKFQQALEANRITPGKLMLAAILPGGFAYLTIQKIGNSDKEAHLKQIELFLTELADDQIALQPAHDQLPVMLAINDPADQGLDLDAIVNVIDK